MVRSHQGHPHPPPLHCMYVNMYVCMYVQLYVLWESSIQSEPHFI